MPGVQTVGVEPEPPEPLVPTEPPDPLPLFDPPEPLPLFEPPEPLPLFEPPDPLPLPFEPEPPPEPDVWFEASPIFPTQPTRRIAVKTSGQRFMALTSSGSWGGRRSGTRLAMRVEACASLLKTPNVQCMDGAWLY